jgi:hypothetical protein
MIDIKNWFIGIVEANNDPSGQRRVRVRIFGAHNTNKSELPTEDLPWSQVMLPATSIQSNNEVLPLNTWVLGFFRDGNEMQDGIIIGALNALASSQEFVSSDPTMFGSSLSPGSQISGIAIPNSQSNPFNFSANVISPSAGGAYVPQTNFSGSGSLSEVYNPNLPKPGELLKYNDSKAQRIVSVALNEAKQNIRETSENQGPGIEKYWSATDYKSGYADRQPWCAAFGCWVVQQSGVLPENIRPKTASAFGFREWANKVGAQYARVTVNPRAVYAGDILVMSYSHLAIAVENSNGSTVMTVDGNSSNRVNSSNKKLSSIACAITII